MGYNRKPEGVLFLFGYVRPNKSELLVREYEQYKAVYCQVKGGVRE